MSHNQIERKFMEENIFANASREGESIEEILNPTVEKELEVEKPTESQAEKEVEKLDLPDESILKKNSAWEEMRVAKEESDSKIADLESKLEALSKSGEEVKQPEFLTDMVGKNEEIARKWQEERNNLKEEVKQELIQAQVDAQKQEADTKAYWDRWTSDQLNKVGAIDPNVRNELRKIMNEYTPTDEQGNLDYVKGMKLLTDLKKGEAQEAEKKIQAKKNIADATVSKETSSKESKGYLTRNDLRQGWRGIVNRD